VEISPIAFDVIEGVRTKERQAKLYAQGRTEAGKIVTWTLNSNHFINPKTGFGHAVDILPKTGWNDLNGFDVVAHAMFQAAMELGIKIRWGADWDQDGNYRERGETDSPHFEEVI
jgi:peptidoglycan L-alanyl-D-glutamate endopeptidase CwlK